MGFLDILPWRKKDGDFDSFDNKDSSFSDPLPQDNNSFGQSQDPFSDPLGSDLGLQYEQHKQQNTQGMSAPSYPQPQQQSDRSFDNPMGSQLAVDTSHHPPSDRRDIELVLAKLDAIKAELDSVHQRVRTIEGTIGIHKQPTTQRYKW